MKYFLSIMILLLFIASAGYSQQEGWKLDKAHSSVTFSVRHMVISEVTGKFEDFEITLNSSKKDFTDAQLRASIKSASLNTDVPQRDTHLKSDDFFNVEKYPEITFTSSSVKKLDDSNYKITGNLTIRDVTKEVTFDATYNGTVAMGKSLHAGWQATTTINRFDYKLMWNKTLEGGGLIVGENVKITLNLEFTKPK